MSELKLLNGFGRRIGELIANGGAIEFDSLARELFRLQSRGVGPLKSLCKARGIAPDELDDWRQFPAMPTAMFKEFELTSLPADDRPYFFLSSGTTERARSRHFHNDTSLKLYERSLLRWFARNVIGDRTFMSFISLTPDSDQAPNSSLVHMFDCIGREHVNGSRFLGCIDDAGDWVAEFEQLMKMLKHVDGPVLLLGTAFSFVHALDWMKSNQQALKLPAGSRVMETGGYKGRSRVIPKLELHRQIRNRFGIAEQDVLCEYGMSELSSQAYDTDRGTDKQGEEARLFRFPPWARALIVSPETGKEVADGEIGLLRIFDLANVWSVMAIQTEDLAVKHGNQFELIGRVPEAEPRGCSLTSA